MTSDYKTRRDLKSNDVCSMGFIQAFREGADWARADLMKSVDEILDERFAYIHAALAESLIILGKEKRGEHYHRSDALEYLTEILTKWQAIKGES